MPYNYFEEQRDCYVTSFADGFSLLDSMVLIGFGCLRWLKDLFLSGRGLLGFGCFRVVNSKQLCCSALFLGDDIGGSGKILFGIEEIGSIARVCKRQKFCSLLRFRMI